MYVSFACPLSVSLCRSIFLQLVGLGGSFFLPSLWESLLVVLGAQISAANYTIDFLTPAITY